MKKLKDIPTIPNDGFKTIMSYYDHKEYSKNNFNDFYIHGLSDDTYEIKIPLPPHRQHKHSIILVTNGSLIASSGFDDYTVNVNEMIVVPAGQITSLSYMSNDIMGFYLHFSPKYLSQTEFDFSDWLAQPLIKFSDTETAHLLVLLKRMQKLNEDETNTNILKSYLSTVLSEIKQSYDFRIKLNFPAHERITLEFKKLLNYSITHYRSASYYAEKLHITTNHLNKSVKATLGKSASSLIDEMLILEAKVLMRNSNIPINEIAFKLGFDDISYFGRFFKKHTEVTPTEYRKMIELSE
ncbi:helix-turn-helix domain-containing protein [Pedobacter aquatilis]|uniref:AraC family transcriptional regulator n=1 Tax=Pedobacter aquatilis TaxID=351343 RepID=UPI00292E8408|nr:helix-turn-helix domain-containing protein [Pedobacter aquatilis]